MKFNVLFSPYHSLIRSVTLLLKSSQHIPLSMIIPKYVALGFLLTSLVYCRKSGSIDNDFKTNAFRGIKAKDHRYTWLRRQDSGAQQAQISTLGETNPFAAAVQADDQQYIKGNTSGSDSSPYSWTPSSGDSQQLPWNTNVYFQASAATNGSETGGWQELPQTPGFILNRTLSIPNENKTGSGIMPFYITENSQTPLNVKRAILMWPGKVNDKH